MFCSLCFTGRRAGDDNARIYLALHWPEGSETTFLSSSYNGDLLMWDLAKPDKEMHQVNLLQAQHIFMNLQLR